MSAVLTNIHIYAFRGKTVTKWCGTGMDAFDVLEFDVLEFEERDYATCLRCMEIEHMTHDDVQQRYWRCFKYGKRRDR